MLARPDPTDGRNSCACCTWTSTPCAPTTSAATATTAPRRRTSMRWPPKGCGSPTSTPRTSRASQPGRAHVGDVRDPQRRGQPRRKRRRLRDEGARRGFVSRYALESWAGTFYWNGWQTASISSFPFRHSATWWNQGFMEAMNLMRGMGAERADQVLPVALDWLERRGRADDWFLHVHLWDPAHPLQRARRVREPVRRPTRCPAWHTEEVRIRNWELGRPPLGPGALGIHPRRMGSAPAPPAVGCGVDGGGQGHLRRLRRGCAVCGRRTRHADEQARRPRCPRRDGGAGQQRPRRGVRRARRVRRPPGGRRGHLPHPGRPPLARRRRRGSTTASTTTSMSLPPCSIWPASASRGAGTARRSISTAQDGPGPPGALARCVVLPARRPLRRPPLPPHLARRLPRALGRRDAVRRGPRPARDRGPLEPRTNRHRGSVPPCWRSGLRPNSTAPGSTTPWTWCGRKGGPSTSVSHLGPYLERLRATGREGWAQILLERHADEL